ncbi:TPA: helix-turn-helix transcriptional regulator [Morganella morganii]|nr:helix-turn-helix transcriptional regulator [Morganella morganii]HAT1529064.1 helix-turn-helix transcriptional regulator [Morganella morganii]HDF2344533.1 helix-turn-helix transcriptional regulator [Morganella morganii]
MISPKEMIGCNIRRIRLSKGLSGAELAERLLCSQQHVSRIERGIVRLNITQIQHLAGALEVSIDNLLEGMGYQYDPLEQIYNQACYSQEEGLFIASHLLLKSHSLLTENITDDYANE